MLANAALEFREARDSAVTRFTKLGHVLLGGAWLQKRAVVAKPIQNALVFCIQARNACMGSVYSHPRDLGGNKVFVNHGEYRITKIGARSGRFLVQRLVLRDEFFFVALFFFFFVDHDVSDYEVRDVIRQLVPDLFLIGDAVYCSGAFDVLPDAKVHVPRFLLDADHCTKICTREWVAAEPAG